MTAQSKKIAGATTALVLLTALNFVNYTDRYILPGVQTLVQREFSLSDARVGTLTTCFFITYMLAAPLTGWLGDRYARKPLIIAGALLWSACNVLTATVHNYLALNIRHAALGVGEASFGIFGPALLSDFFPEDERNRVLTIFYIAIPVGAALGYGMGGILGSMYGWRMPFIVSAVPGFAIAALIWIFMKEPKRGASDKRRKATPSRTTVLGLATNWGYVSATLGMAMVVFSLGGISWWMPTFLNRIGGYSLAQAGLYVGAVTATAGLTGTAVGGWAAHLWLRRNEQALYLISSLSALLAVPFAMFSFLGPRWGILPGIWFAIFCIMLGNGPLNAAIVNSVGPGVRASAIAIELFLIHALGDAPSPWLIGLVSDKSNLRVGLVLTLVTMLVAAVILYLGAKHTPPAADAEMRRWLPCYEAMPMTPGLSMARDLVAAGVSLLWLQRAVSLLVHLPWVPDVRDTIYDAQPEGSLTVIVPARDEAAHIEATLRSLLAQDLSSLQIIAVNDRSVDETGAIMERVAAEAPERLRVMHITELPAGWVGKPHAMAMAASTCETEWLLFTDADVVFASDALRRALVGAEKTKSDHLALAPTMQMRGWDEGIILGFFQAASLWVARPWRIPKRRAKHDHTGLGAFNMVRREAYEAIGGFTALRMEVLEDVRLGILLKRAGFTQRLVFGRDLVRVHWASGVNGLLGVMTKNMFSLFRFRPALLLAGCAAIFLFCVMPFWWIFTPGAAPRSAGWITVAAIVLIYRAYGKHSGIPAWYAALFPVGALLMIFALLRSMVVTWREGGVRWRGTLYTLAELRKNAGPFL